MEHALAHVIMKLLLNWVIRGTKPDAEPTSDGNGWVMRYCSRCVKLYAAMALLLDAFVVFFLLIIKLDPKLGLVGVGLFGLMFLASLYNVTDSRRRTVRLDDEGLTILRSFRGPLSIEWADIRSVSFSETSGVLKIRRVVGSSGTISVGMHGLGTLAWHLDRYAPGTITADARRFLPVSYCFASQSMEANTE